MTPLERPSRAVRLAAILIPMACAVLVALPACGGKNPATFCAISFALAAVAAGLVAAFLLAWPVPPLCAGLGAALFAVHPARSEAILRVSGMSELLMTVFSFAALLIAQSARGFWRWPCAGLAALAAAFSNEQGFALVLLVPLLPGLARRERIAGALVVGVTLCVAFLWRRHVPGVITPSGAMQVLPSASSFDLVMFALHHLGRYVRLFFWPAPLRDHYDEPTMPVCWMYVVLAVVTLVAPLVLFFRHRPRAAYAVLLFLVPLLPVLDVADRTGVTFAERFLCLPLAGCAALVALLGARVPPRNRLIAASVLAAAILACSALFLDRARA